MYRAPSQARLTEAFDITADDAKRIRRLIHNCNGNGRNVENVLAKIDKIIDACGVETVRNGTESFSGYWCDCAAAYVNTGDTYSPTIMYVVESDTFRLIDWETFVENYRGPGQIV